ncbi:MAG: arylsulfatase A, partial [Planctomycetota bacterium]
AACVTTDKPSVSSDDRPPNILFIMADDMGYGDPACYNPDSKIETPTIDSLAAEGIRFTDAHSPGALCVSSRYGLLTGRYPCRKNSLRPGREAVIDEGRVTIASLLKSQGYRTGMIGKWHLGFDGGVNDPGSEMFGGPIDRGFDDFFGMHASLDIPPYYYIRGRVPVAPPTEFVQDSSTAGWTAIQGAFWRKGKIAPGFDHAEVQTRFEEEAITWLDTRAQQPEEPFFLYVALAAPHTPWLPSREFEGTSAADLYGDFVAQVDAGVGRILAALERNGQAKDTLIIFTSDNGPVWYPADVERLGHDSVCGLRGMKADAYEGGHRVPFIAKWPGHIPQGCSNDALVCFTDVLSTLAELTSAPLPKENTRDGFSLLSALLDPDARTQRESLILKAGATAYRKGRWKLITHPGSGGFTRSPKADEDSVKPAGQLYDLEVDLAETSNLWNEHPEVVKQLHAELEREQSLEAER